MTKKFRYHKRTFLVLVIAMVLFFLLFGRITYIQLTGKAEGEHLKERAEKKYSRLAVLPAQRGSIVDRDGETIAAETVSYRVFAVLDKKLSEDVREPVHVVDPKKTAKILSTYLDMKEAEIHAILTKDKKQVEFGRAGRNIPHEVYVELKEEKLPGVIITEEKKRFYPNGEFASHLIGFALREETEENIPNLVGKMGLELTYNEALTGTDGKYNYQADRYNFTLPKSEELITPAVNGQDIQLTLDKTIQNLTEDAMRQVEKVYQPKKMLAIVMDPKTGAILAMSQRPSFNPATLEGITSNWLNEVVENTIEPGSTMKTFTLAGAIEEDKWDPNAYFMSGKYKIYDRTIRDHYTPGWGMISFLEGFQRSSNVSIAYLRERMGDEALSHYMDAFGFGKKTGIDLPNEAGGKLLSDNPIERLTTAYGQGSTVTPIQMVQAATAIANDGVMMRPYVIDKITDPNTGEVIENHQPEEVGKPISKETAEKTLEVLASTVTSKHGTGSRYALNGYTLAGKTGTAEIPRSSGQGYLSGHGNYLYSFLGMAPAEDPQLITYIYVQQPKLPSDETGAVPVAKLFTAIMENSLKYLNIAPQTTDAKKLEPLPNYIGKEAHIVTSEVQKSGLETTVIGAGGKVTAQYPEESTILPPGAMVLVQTDGDRTLPDFTGWSKKMVLAYKLLSGLDIRVTGEGFVSEQNLSAGQVVKEEETIVIQLRTPAEQFEIEQLKKKEQIEETEESEESTS